MIMFCFCAFSRRDQSHCYWIRALSFQTTLNGNKCVLGLFQSPTLDWYLRTKNKSRIAKIFPFNLLHYGKNFLSKGGWDKTTFVKKVVPLSFVLIEI